MKFYSVVKIDKIEAGCFHEVVAQCGDVIAGNVYFGVPNPCWLKHKEGAAGGFSLNKFSTIFLLN